MVRIFMAAVAGAVVAFLWGWAYWLAIMQPVALHEPVPSGEEAIKQFRKKLAENVGELPELPTKTAENEVMFAEVLKGYLPEDGVYMYPLPVHTGETEETAAAEKAKLVWEERLAAGPIFTIYYQREGVQATDVRMLAKGFAHEFVSCLLAGMLLSMSRLAWYPSRLIFVALLGTFAAVWVRGLNPIWWHQPWDYNLYHAAYDVSTWVLVGIVMAAIVRPPKRA